MEKNIMMKYLILTVTAGEGHNSIAKALKNEISKNPENEVKVIDIFKKYSNSMKVSIINDGYVAAVKYAMPLYNMIFKMLQNLKPENRNKMAAQGTVSYESAKLLQDIYFYEPDVILSTHFYPAIIITNLRKKYPIPAKTFSIVTDYVCHPFWEGTIGIDYLIMPDEEFREQLLYKGFKNSQLLSYGLPVKNEFSEVVEKDFARKELGLDKNMFTVLVMFGGGGFGDSIKVLKKLFKVKFPIQIVIVNGKDKASQKRINTILKTKKTKHKIYNLGFINYVSMLMSACDVVCGKCGGITTNEALNKRLPMICTRKLAQQEVANAEFLQSHGAGMIYDSENKLEDIITNLAQNPQLIKDMVSNIDKIRKPNALKDLCSKAQSCGNVISYKNCPDISKQDLQKVRSDIRKALHDKREKEKQKVIKERAKALKKLNKMHDELMKL